MNYNDPIVGGLLLKVSNANVLDRPMSKDARRLLEDMIRWGTTKASKLFQVSDPSLACVQAFLSEFDVLQFEEACHTYDLKQYANIVNKSYSPNRVDNLLNVMHLRNLNASWAHDNGIKINTNRVGSFSRQGAKDLYNWITTYYVLTDFTCFDVNKIIELSGEEFDIQTIKSEANKIHDSDKKNIAYLYAIIKDVTSRERAVRSQEKEKETKYQAKLDKVFSYGGLKLSHTYVDNKTEWQRHREWLETFLDLKKNDN